VFAPSPVTLGEGRRPGVAASSYHAGMATLPTPRRPRRANDQLILRIGVGVLAVLAAIMVLNWVLGAIFALIRVALLLVLLGVVAWFVLIGPPGDDGD
jgi:uncharacterized membrane protein